jgi:hypothetical protein
MSSYQWDKTTNAVENIHSIRRKFLDKRLNFAKSFSVRADLALLTLFMPSWLENVLTGYFISFYIIIRLNLPFHSSIKLYNISEINRKIYHKQRNQKETVKQRRYQLKSEKYGQKEKTGNFTYKKDSDKNKQEDKVNLK